MQNWIDSLGRLVTAATAASMLFLLIATTPVHVAAQNASLADSATPVSSFKLLPGFQVELLHSVPSGEQGSWVSMTVDPKGRIVASDQYGKLYRITPPPIGSADKIVVEQLPVEMGGAHGLLYAFDSLYVVVSESPGRGKKLTKPQGLYRLRDTNGDDQYDEVTLLRQLKGGGEHGPHAVILSPDKKSLYICGGNHTDLPSPETSRVPRNWKEDQLLPRMWDAGGHAVGKMAPGGWICRLDPDGKNWELISSGYRNQFDLAFNESGELFTFDADMEWDIGTPWYRPTRVNHVTSGSEFGWRSGTGKWPSYYPDSLPAVVDIGPGSPTGIAFGSGGAFPAKYQRALFVADWSYGIMYAVHMKPQGSSYTATFEQFVTAAPLPITDILIHPVDRAMYFTIGGRRTQSGMYRVTYRGKESTELAPVIPDAEEEQRELRHRLEKLHTADADDAVNKAWPYLSHADRFIRYAARIAIEHQPLEQWKDRALAEKHPDALIQAIVALARSSDAGATDNAQTRKSALTALQRVQWNGSSEDQRLRLLRAVSLVLIRMGAPDQSPRGGLIDQFSPQYPSKSQFLNQELARLLVYLQAPGTAERTVALMENAGTQEEQLHYALCLRALKSGWTLDTRRKYFDWFLRATAHRGGHSFSGFLRNIREEALKTLSEKEKTDLAGLLAKTPKPEPVKAVPPRPLVQKWTVEDLLADVQSMQSRDFVRGREMFAVAACLKCHRFRGSGGITGPDLSSVGGRFNAKNILESLIEPSKTISDQYQATAFFLNNGKTVVGRVANLSGGGLSIITNMLEPGTFTNVPRKQIERTEPSQISPMPTGLLDTLTKDETLDLIAYMRSGGDPNHPFFAISQSK